MWIIKNGVHMRPRILFYSGLLLNSEVDSNLIWASTLVTRIGWASGLLLGYDTLADLLILYLQAWSYAWSSCSYQLRQPPRDHEQRDFQGRKRVGEQQAGRDVRQMTEADLRHKIEDRHRNYNQHQPWEHNQVSTQALQWKVSTVIKRVITSRSTEMNCFVIVVEMWVINQTNVLWWDQTKAYICVVMAYRVSSFILWTCLNRKLIKSREWKNQLELLFLCWKVEVLSLESWQSFSISWTQNGTGMLKNLGQWISGESAI